MTRAREHEAMTSRPACPAGKLLSLVALPDATSGPRNAVREFWTALVANSIVAWCRPRI